MVANFSSTAVMALLIALVEEISFCHVILTYSPEDVEEDEAETE